MKGNDIINHLAFPEKIVPPPPMSFFPRIWHTPWHSNEFYSTPWNSFTVHYVVEEKANSSESFIFGSLIKITYNCMSGQNVASILSFKNTKWITSL